MSPTVKWSFSRFARVFSSSPLYSNSTPAIFM